MVNVRHVHLVIPVAIFLLAGSGRAELYRYVDAQGRVHFSNAPADVRYRPLRIRDSRAAAMRSYEEMIRKAAAEYGIDPLLIKAVIRVESNFDRYAVSHKGARGLMQLMPATAREMEVEDPFDPLQNITGGSRYLKMMLDRFDNDLSLSLAAYNAGPELVGKVGRVPKIKETRSYVSKVKKAYHRYR